MLPEVIHPGWRVWRRLATRMAIGLGVIAVIVAFHAPILRGVAGLFRVDNPAKSDALMILMGGAEHRPARAAELYFRGIAPVILVGTASIDPRKLLKETDMTLRELKRLGVPPEAIVVLPGLVTSTREEARSLAGYAVPRGLRRITVVTTSFHTARAWWIFHKELRGTGIEIRMGAADHPDFTEANWYRSDEGMVAYFTEAIKTAYYRLRY